MSRHGYKQTSGRPKLRSASPPTPDVPGGAAEGPKLTQSRPKAKCGQGMNDLVFAGVFAIPKRRLSIISTGSQKGYAGTIFDLSIRSGFAPDRR